jgi:hypothetical protein
MLLSTVKSQNEPSVSSEFEVPQDLIHEIENLKEAQTYELIGALLDQIELTYFALGGILSRAQTNGWRDGYPSFREFVEGKYGLAYRKAMYLMKIYNSLVESKVPWSKVADLGWSKLREIAPLLTLANVDDWVTLAQQQNHVQLVESVKVAQGKKKTPDDLSMFTFHPNMDQRAKITAALAKAKEVSGTDVSSVALEYICLDYLSGQTLAQQMLAIGPAGAAKAIVAAFDTPEELASFMAGLGIENALAAIQATVPHLSIIVSE